jgi:hypothetical protein
MIPGSLLRGISVTEKVLVGKAEGSEWMVKKIFITYC